MDFSDQATLYDLLDLDPDATPNEIREAYMRIKSTFQKDSPALYSLMDAADGTEMIQKIEHAYEILSNPQKRKEYDRNFGQLGMETSNVFSIDRRPPMEPVEDDSILVAPSTDHGYSSPSAPIAPGLSGMTAPGSQMTAAEEDPQAFKINPVNAAAEVKHAPAQRASAPPPVSPPSLPPPHRPPPATKDSDLDAAIRAETEWSGAFLRKVRESRGLAPEDIMAATRITKAYLLALEEENFAKLPAPVYIRGFIMQIAKILKLPAPQVTTAYLERCRKAFPHKFQY